MKHTERTRSRTSPITESITKIKDYPKTLAIYRQNASRFWWIRYYVNHKLYRKSTKTENKEIASEIAKQFYKEISFKELENTQKSDVLLFENCANQMLKDQQFLIDRKERSPNLNKDEYQKLRSDIFPYFKNKHVSDILYQDINSYIQHISQRNLKPSTLKKHIVLINKVLKHALRQNLIRYIPPMPSIRMKDNARGWFNKNEYLKLKQVTRELVRDQKIVRYQNMTDEIRVLITFMINSFLRPSDLRHLKHRNIEIIKREHTYLKIQTDSSKTHNYPIVTLKNAVRVYEYLLKYYEKNQIAHSSDDYVFYPHLKNRNYAIHTLRRQFNEILFKSNLKKTSIGEERTVYSLRHTAIMFRLTNGHSIDLLTLARNARTSVDMIERFYAKPLSAEMNINLLQMNGRKF
jgi:hypothetical protein